MLSRVLCKADWLNDPANEKFKNVDGRAQEKAFKESGHWKNADKKVNLPFGLEGGLIMKTSQGLEAMVRQSSSRGGMHFCLPLDNIYNSSLACETGGE